MRRFDRPFYLPTISGWAKRAHWRECMRFARTEFNKSNHPQSRTLLHTNLRELDARSGDGEEMVSEKKNWGATGTDNVRSWTYILRCAKDRLIFCMLGNWACCITHTKWNYARFGVRFYFEFRSVVDRVDCSASRFSCVCVPGFLSFSLISIFEKNEELICRRATVCKRLAVNARAHTRIHKFSRPNARRLCVLRLRSDNERKKKKMNIET